MPRLLYFFLRGELHWIWFFTELFCVGFCLNIPGRAVIADSTWSGLCRSCCTWWNHARRVDICGAEFFKNWGQESMVWPNFDLILIQSLLITQQNITNESCYIVICHFWAWHSQSSFTVEKSVQDSLKFSFGASHFFWLNNSN